MEAIVNFFNPLNEDFFVYQIINGIGEFFFGDGTEENRGLFGLIGDILSFLGNFFGNLLDFFVHIFVPDDGQWEEIKESYSDLGDLIKTKLPFISFWQESLEDAKSEVIASNDMLTITMPSFSFFGGETEEKQVINVKEAYEPYRIKIRSLLALVVYGCGIVYLIKTVLNYKSTATGLDHAEIQSHLKDK